MYCYMYDLCDFILKDVFALYCILQDVLIKSRSVSSGPGSHFIPGPSVPQDTFMHCCPWKGEWIAPEA